MSSFTEPLVVEIGHPHRRDRGLLCKVVKPFVYALAEPADEQGLPTSPAAGFLRVEAGFFTDFSSIPRMFWWIEPPLGVAAKAAVLHDWLYSKKIFPRHEADSVFLEAMKVLKVPAWKRYPMWLAVRLFGGGGYGREDTPMGRTMA